MHAHLIRTCGREIAVKAARLSYNSVGTGKDSDDILLRKLVAHGPSHSKAIRMIQYWLEIRAPRFWWAEFDTYKVGTTTASESTMHTLYRAPLTPENFEGDHVTTTQLKYLNEAIEWRMPIDVLKCHLPEGFLQTRIVNLNVQTLRTIWWDRKNHRLPQWAEFCAFLEELPDADLIVQEPIS